jgi:hypothetical protein
VGATATRSQFLRGILQDMGGSISNANSVNMLAAIIREEGSNPAWNNYLDTTLPYDGSYTINSAGVMAYPSPAAGEEATVQTLEEPYYPKLYQAIRTGNAKLFEGKSVRQELDTWGGGAGYAGHVESIFASEQGNWLGNLVTTASGGAANAAGTVANAPGAVAGAVTGDISNWFTHSVFTVNHVILVVAILAGLVILGAIVKGMIPVDSMPSVIPV